MATRLFVSKRSETLLLRKRSESNLREFVSEADPLLLDEDLEADDGAVEGVQHEHRERGQLATEEQPCTDHRGRARKTVVSSGVHLWWLRGMCGGCKGTLLGVQFTVSQRMGSARHSNTVMENVTRF